MKRLEKLYIVLSYLSFVFPPFLLGLVAIFRERAVNPIHIITLFVNLIVLVGIAVTLFILVWKKKLHKPTPEDIKYLIFGLIGNSLVYLYAFQRVLGIGAYMTTYLLVILVLGFHSLLIARKFQSKEMWILMIAFAFIDYSRLFITSCSFDEHYCNLTAFQSGYTVAMGITSVAVIFGYYTYRIIKLKHWDPFKIVNSILILVLSIWFIFFPRSIDGKIYLTMMIMTPFLIILDYIVSLVNKTYTVKTTIFYLRTFTLLMLSVYLSLIRFVEHLGDYQVLVIMIVVTYVSLLIVIITSTSKLGEESAALPTLKFHYKKLTEEDIASMKEQFDLSINTESDIHYYIAIHQGIPVGYLKYDFNVFLLGGDYINQCNLLEINIKKEYMDILPATLLSHFEHEMKLNEVYQISGELETFHIDLKLLLKRQYVFLNQNQFMKKIV